MIAFVKGILEYKEPENSLVVIDCQGIGYNIYVPGSVLDTLPSKGGEVKLYTHLSVREDAMQLYGFTSGEQLTFFRMLIGVNGIGPKAALGILSAFSIKDLRFAILADDEKMISKAPGIGAKTARKIILEIKDKLSFEEAAAADFSSAESAGGELMTSGQQNAEDAAAALIALGYSSAEALKAVRAVNAGPDMKVDDILKAALKHIS